LDITQAKYLASSYVNTANFNPSRVGLPPLHGGNMKRLTFISLLIVSALMLSACGLHTGLGSLLNPGKATSKPSTSANGTPSTKHVKATHTPPAPDSISITAKGFNPESLTVKVGSAVTWANASKNSETVTSDTAGLFDSGPLNTGAVFTYTFSTAGTFTYHSTTTTTLKGTVVVTP
jgi:plastocyanin